MKKPHKDSYLNLFSFCKVVEGKERSIICDFQKEKIKFIPNEMVIVLKQLQQYSFDIVKEQFKNDAKIFDSYITFLLDEGFVFYSQEKENFVVIENYWSSPEIITNAIIEYDFKTYDIHVVLQQLDNLLTKFIELRCTIFKEQHILELKEIIKFCSSSVLRSIRLYIPFVSKDVSNSVIEQLEPFSCIESIVFYNDLSAKTVKKINNDRHVFFIPHTLERITKANIDKKFLVNTIDHFYECQRYSPYYNKKVAIDQNGWIKNCIKNIAVFGNIKEDTIDTVIQKKEFREFWYATHDKILDIKDNELRYNYIITNDLEKQDNGYYKIIA